MKLVRYLNQFIIYVILLINENNHIYFLILRYLVSLKNKFCNFNIVLLIEILTNRSLFLIFSSFCFSLFEKLIIYETLNIGYRVEKKIVNICNSNPLILLFI